MITLLSTGSLQFVLAGAKTSVDAVFAASYEDNSQVASQQGSLSGPPAAPSAMTGTTNGTTAVTIVPAPSGVGLTRRLKSFELYNADTGSITVSLVYNDNGTSRKIFTATLATLENLTYEDGVGFQAFTAAGARK